MTDFALVVGISGIAALASLVGGWLSLHRNPTTLFLSLTLGTAGGVLLGAIAFEMIPQAMGLSSTTDYGRWDRRRGTCRLQFRTARDARANRWHSCGPTPPDPPLSPPQPARGG